MSAYPLRQVMAATDFSPSSAAAFEYGLSLARTCSAGVVIVHVMERSVSSMDFTTPFPDFTPEFTQRTTELLQAWVDHAEREGVVATPALLIGLPFTELCEEAKRRSVDLIVMGTHGRTGLAHLVLGSTAERVVRLASCPVLTVKAPLSNAAPAGMSNLVLPLAHSQR